MSLSRRSRARWAVIALLAATAGALWEIGADAGRLRIVLRFLGGQTVSLASAGASDTYVFVAYFVEAVALGGALVAFFGWRRRTGDIPAMHPGLALAWRLWLMLNVIGRLAELTVHGSSSLDYLRAVTVIDLVDTLVVAASLVAMVRVVRRTEARLAADDSDDVPATSIRIPRALTALLSALLVVAPLTLALVVSNGTQTVTHTPVTPTSTLWQTSNATSTTCADPMFQPAGAIAAGANSLCAHLTLGSSLFAADCTKATKLPAGLWPEIFDSTGKSSTLGTVAVGGGGCAIATRSTSVTAAVFAGNATGPSSEPGSLIVVADFIPATNTSGLTTLGVRVSSSDELDIAIGSGGDYAVIESVAGDSAEAILQGTFATSPGTAPDLSKPVRLVVSVQGKTATVYLDGRLLGSGPTAVPNDAGDCGFSISTSDATKPVVTKLLRFDIFAAS